jgi:hypothetical protein
MAQVDLFKSCSFCRKQWPDRDSFLCDSSVALIGYSANFKNLELGVLIFNHLKPGCRTTLGIKAKDFSDLYSGEIFQDRNTGKEGCPGYCLEKSELNSCSMKCECAYIREVIQIIKGWPKGASL